MQILLGIKRTDFGEINPGYLRLLAANETGRKLIRKAKKEELKPILTDREIFAKLLKNNHSLATLKEALKLELS